MGVSVFNPPLDGRTVEHGGVGVMAPAHLSFLSIFFSTEFFQAGFLRRYSL